MWIGVPALGWVRVLTTIPERARGEDMSSLVSIQAGRGQINCCAVLLQKAPMLIAPGMAVAYCD